MYTGLGLKADDVFLFAVFDADGTVIGEARL